MAHVRMDGAWLGSVDIAIKKAWTARAFDVETKALAKLAQPGEDFSGIHMATFIIHAAWTLAVTSALSLVSALYRATAQAGTSAHDSPRGLATQGLPVCDAAGVVIALLLSGAGRAAWIGLGFSVVMILVSVPYYDPRMREARRPGVVDRVEDLVYTGLLVLGWVGGDTSACP
jgi:hypothetical protein